MRPLIRQHTKPLNITVKDSERLAKNRYPLHLFAKRSSRAFIFFLILSFPGLPIAASSRDELQLTVGAEYTTGTFGSTESIDGWYIPVTGRVIRDNYVFRLTIPYISLTAPTGTVAISGGDGEIITSGTGERTTEGGVGDIIASITYQDLFNTESTDLAVDLTGKIKFGTANENKGLGTGENDYTIQADIFRFYDRFTPFGALGYTFRGDPPGVKLRNVWFGIIGASYSFSPVISTSLDYYTRQSSFTEGTEQQELTVQLGYKIDKDRKLRAYVLRGLSDVSPDWGGGLMLTFRH